MSDTTPETPPQAHRPRWRTGDVVAMGLAAALVVGSAGTGLFVATRAVENEVAAASTQADTTTSIPDGRSFGGPPAATGGTESGSTSLDSGLDSTLDTGAATAEQSVGVVVIDTVLSYESAAAAGTGIILSADGRILTNNHVVEGATGITVTVVSTGAEYTAEVVGTSATEDLAVLELVDASGLAVADLDSTGAVAIGDTVTGVGNANGTGTLTAAAGTVLDLEQQITAQNADGSDAEDLIGLIEVDADIQSGESGGPLFDADGEVIGVNTAASSGTPDITGYAIPIEDALAIVDAIEAAAATGEDTDTISVGYPAFLGIGLGGSTDAASVAGVIADTPAEAIGLAAGDTITAVDGTAIATASALSAALAGYEPGDTVTIDWVDATGSTHSAAATLIAGPVG